MLWAKHLTLTLTLATVGLIFLTLTLLLSYKNKVKINIRELFDNTFLSEYFFLRKKYVIMFNSGAI